MAGISDDALLLYLLYPDGADDRAELCVSRALARHGSLAEAAAFLRHTATSPEGVGTSAGLLLQAVFELASRLIGFTATRDPQISDVDTVVTYCRLRAAPYRVETIRVLYLDATMRLISEELHQEGTLNGVVVDVVGIIRRALALNASALVIAHSAPGAEPPNPFGARRAYLDIQDAGISLGIRVHEYLLICARSYRRIR